MSDYTNWFNSDERTKYCDSIAQIPVWRRFFLCLLSFRTWKTARCLTHSALYALRVLGDDDLFNRLLIMSDRLWADIYGVEKP